jgi:hypothetical protein
MPAAALNGLQIMAVPHTALTDLSFNGAFVG